MNESKITGNNVGENLKIILVKKGMNIVRLAELMGVSSTTLYTKFKKGNFSIKDLNKISEALNISYEISFTIKEEGTPNVDS